jgi:hypothetical protein
MIAGLAFVALAGALLGLRFKVFALVAMILIIGLGIVAKGAATSQGFPAIFLTLVAAVSCLQISYLLAGIVGAYLPKRATGPAPDLFRALRTAIREELKPDLFRALRTAIGNELKTSYPVTDELPPDMISLLKQLN